MLEGKYEALKLCDVELVGVFMQQRILGTCRPIACDPEFRKSQVHY